MNDLPFNIYITTNHDGIRKLLESFAIAAPETKRVVDGDVSLHVWEHLDWMEIYLAYNRLEEMLAAWPAAHYHLMCYGDAFDEAGEMGELNHFNITLERKVHYDNPANRMG